MSDGPHDAEIISLHGPRSPIPVLLMQRFDEVGLDASIVLDTVGDISSNRAIDTTANTVESFGEDEDGSRRGFHDFGSRIRTELPVAFRLEAEIEEADVESIVYRDDGYDLPKKDKPVMRVFLFPSTIRRSMKPTEHIFSFYPSDVYDAEEINRTEIFLGMMGSCVLGLTAAYATKHLDELSPRQANDLMQLTGEIDLAESYDARRRISLSIAGAVATRYLFNAVDDFIPIHSPKDRKIIETLLRLPAQSKPERTEGIIDRGEASYALKKAYTSDQMRQLAPVLFG